MCGIVGYIGKKQAAPVLPESLARLEYRDYDSAGIAVRNGGAATELVKAKGRLRAPSEKTDGGLSVTGCCGIGHTRRATHGEPSETNAHPHCGDDGNVILVHNGVVENYVEPKEKLLGNGYAFYSRTDALFTPSPAVLPLQLMGYYVSVARGLDADKPRDLAKSVTVE